MNEFEWRRQMRQLRQPMAPERDLWPAINHALAADDAHSTKATSRAQQPRRRRWLAAAGLAAAVLLCVGTFRHLSQQKGSASVASNTVVSHWKPTDPRLAGAAIELDAARMELQQAMLQAPDSPALQRLLARTERQQTQLHQLTGHAG